MWSTALSCQKERIRSGARRFGVVEVTATITRVEMQWKIRETSTRGMPRRRRPRKDAATRRNAPGRRWRPGIRRSPNGATRPGHARAPDREVGGAPRELKHLSTARKREDSPSSGER